jgi:serine/threonine-protein kinase
MLIVWPLFTHLRTGGSVQTWRQLQAAQTLLRNYDEDDNLNQAVSELQKILTHQPHHAGAAASLAVAYCILNGGDSQDSTWLKRAEVSAQLALQTDDQLALAHVARAWFLEQVGRLREAEVSYDQALLLDPHELYGLWGRGRMLTRLNRFGEAHEVLRKALVLYPREALLYNTLGALLYKQANYRDAEREFRRSIELKPNSPYGYANLNAALLHQNRVDEALSVLQQGLRIQSNGVLYNNLGNALFARGRFLEAAEAFERALSNSKGNPNDYLKWANLADALRWVPGRQAASNRAYSRALQLLAPQLQAGASDATRLSRASLYAAKLARADQSRTWINAALAHAAEVPDVLFRAAIVAELLDDRVRALQYLKDSLACGFPAHLIEQEPDLQGLRRDLSYHQLLTEDRR